MILSLPALTFMLAALIFFYAVFGVGGMIVFSLAILATIL